MYEVYTVFYFFIILHNTESSKKKKKKRMRSLKSAVHDIMILYKSLFLLCRHLKSLDPLKSND